MAELQGMEGVCKGSGVADARLKNDSGPVLWQNHCCLSGWGSGLGRGVVAHPVIAIRVCHFHLERLRSVLTMLKAMPQPHGNYVVHVRGAQRVSRLLYTSSCRRGDHPAGTARGRGCTAPCPGPTC